MQVYKISLFGYDYIVAQCLLSYKCIRMQVIYMQLKCRDVGVDCDFEIKGASSEEEIMQLAAVHAKIVHHMDSIPPELIDKAKKAIKK